MAADGGHGPKPWAKRQLSTTFLRVPYGDWPAVKRGLKREFRAGSGNNQVPQLWGVRPPTLVVAYSIDSQFRHDRRLMVLEDMRQEPLGAISPESLEREGFATLAEFRTYWMAREHRRFTPTRMIFAYRLRPVYPADLDAYADAALEHLYGDFIDGVSAAA